MKIQMKWFISCLAVISLSLGGLDLSLVQAQAEITETPTTTPTQIDSATETPVPTQVPDTSTPTLMPSNTSAQSEVVTSETNTPDLSLKLSPTPQATSANLQALSVGSLSVGSYNENHSSISLTSKWAALLDPSTSNGSQIRTSIYGQTASFSFSGNKLIIIHTKARNGGIFRVTIDGTNFKFKTYKATEQYQASWESPVLANGLHTVVIQKQKSDKKPIFFDGLIILDTTSAQVPTKSPTPEYTPTSFTAPTETWTLTSIPSPTPEPPTQMPTWTPTLVPPNTSTLVPILFLTNTATLVPTLSFTPIAFPTNMPASSGLTYYVSLSGNDANNGTQSTPWRTIQKAVNTAPIGSTITVSTGTYPERVTISRALILQAQGRVVMRGFTVTANHVTLRGFEITDTPNDDIAGWGIYVRASNCLIENNYVHYTTRGGINLFAKPGEEVLTSNCIVRNNRLYRNSQLGIEVNGMNHLVEKNEVWGIIQYHPSWVNPPSYVDADGMRFFGSGHIFRGNYIHDISMNDPENINPHIDAFQTWDSNALRAGNNCVFEKNRIVLGYGGTTGFQLAGGTHDLTIRNNIVQAFAGIRSYKNKQSPYTIPGNLFILNNLFIGDLSYTNWPIGVTIQDTINVVVKNNIFYNQADYTIDIANSTGVEANYNLAYNSNGSIPRSPIGTPLLNNLWGVNPLFVNPTNTGEWGVNPLFVNPNTGDYHLQAGSPAIDAGIPLPNVTNDFDATIRPQGSGYDIGPYEYRWWLSNK